MNKKIILFFILAILQQNNWMFAITPNNSKYDDKMRSLTELPAPSGLTADTADTEQIQLTEGQILLSWTANGPWEDTTGYESISYYYQIRYSNHIINSLTAWNSADTLAHDLVPADSGDAESLSLPTDHPVLQADSTYYFAIRSFIEAYKKTVDTTGDTNMVFVADTSSIAYTSIGKKPHKDDIPPSPIGDLTVSQDTTTNPATGSPTPNRALLIFTTPGDNYQTGRAHGFTIKFSTVAITASNFNSAKTYSYSGDPKYPGEKDTIFIIDSLRGDNIYYMAMKTYDENNNVSSISNVDTVHMPMVPDSLEPTPITDLRGQTGPLKGSVRLTWTAPEDTLYHYPAKKYILKYSHSSILTDTDFDNAQTYSQNWNPIGPGQTESKIVTGFNPGETYYFSIKALDFTNDTSDFHYSPYAYAQAYDSVFLPILSLEAQNNLVSVYDTVAVKVNINPNGYGIKGLSFYATIDTEYFSPIDQDSVRSGIQPFKSEKYFPYSIELENDLHGDSIGKESNGIAGYQLDFTEAIDTAHHNLTKTDSGTIATFYLLALKTTPVNTTVSIDFDTTNARESMAINQYGESIAIEGRNLYLRNQYYLTLVDAPLQGRSSYEGNYTARVLTSSRSPLSSAFSPLHEPIAITGNNEGLLKVPYVPTGKYIILIKEPRYLSGEVSINVSSTSISREQISFTSIDDMEYNELRGGDANNDNRVNLADFGQLAYYYDQNVPVDQFESGALWEVDFNNDGYINISDFSILASNFGERGSQTSQNRVASPQKNILSRPLIARDDSSATLTFQTIPECHGFEFIFQGNDFDYNLGNWSAKHDFMKISTVIDSSFHICFAFKAGQADLSGEEIITIPIGSLPKLRSFSYLDTAFQMKKISLNQVSVIENQRKNNKTSVSTYPNPFPETVHFKFSQLPSSIPTLEIFQLDGKRVFKKKITVEENGIFRWSPRGRASGIYLYRIHSNDFNVRGKILYLK